MIQWLSVISVQITKGAKYITHHYINITHIPVVTRYSQLQYKGQSYLATDFSFTLVSGISGFTKTGTTCFGGAALASVVIVASLVSEGSSTTFSVAELKINHIIAK